MFVRILQVVAVILYIFGAIGGVAYLGGSMLWLVPLLAPALYFVFTLPDIARSLPPTPQHRDQNESRIQELKNGPPPPQ